MQLPSVQILHTGGHYPALVEEHLRSQGAPVTTHQLSADSFQTLDDPEQYLPRELGEADVVIAIALPPGLITALPPFLADTRCRALLVPVEDPTWVRPGLERQLQGLCKAAGMECAVSMPFCALAGGGEVIGAFCKQYRVGRPRLEIEVSDGLVTTARCVQGAPCGLTHWVAERLPGTAIEEVVERAKVLHHSRPCMASMALLRESGDTLMHVSLDIMKRAAASAVRRVQGDSVIRNRP